MNHDLIHVALVFAGGFAFWAGTEIGHRFRKR